MSVTQKMIVRVLASFAVVYAAAALHPTPAEPTYVAAAAICAATLYAVVLARALKRHDVLQELVGLELNKIRRVYHLGKNLSEDSRFRQWFTDLHGYLYGYLTAFDKKDFSEYETTNGDFRKLSYHLYSIEELKTEKERVLYRELLEAAGIVAGTRQRIQETWSGSLSKPLWTMLTGVGVLAALTIVMSLDPSNTIVAGLLLAVGVCSAALVRDADSMKTVSGKAMAKRYVENIARLELRHRDDE